MPVAAEQEPQTEKTQYDPEHRIRARPAAPGNSSADSHLHSPFNRRRSGPEKSGRAGIVTNRKWQPEVFLVTQKGDRDRTIAWINPAWLSGVEGSDAYIRAFRLAVEVAQNPEDAGNLDGVFDLRHEIDSNARDVFDAMTFCPLGTAEDDDEIVPFHADRFARMLRLLVNADDADEVTISTPGKPTWKVSGLRTGEPTFTKVE